MCWAFVKRGKKNEEVQTRFQRQRVGGRKCAFSPNVICLKPAWFIVQYETWHLIEMNAILHHVSQQCFRSLCATVYRKLQISESIYSLGI